MLFLAHLVPQPRPRVARLLGIAYPAWLLLSCFGCNPTPTCESFDDCSADDSVVRQSCCPGGVCEVSTCLSGAAPPPRCALRETPCGDGTVCVDEPTCGGGGYCRPDCRVTGDCAALGLVCEGDVCEPDCSLPGFAGCSADLVCRENGRCGVPLCDAGTCGPAAACVDVTAGLFSHLDDGCRPAPCQSSSDCPGGTFCVNGACSEEEGVCTDTTPPPP